MRHFILLTVLCFIWPAYAAEEAKPKDLEPLPELVTPPAATDVTPEQEPQVTIKKRGRDKIEEYRMNGRLYMVKVTPPHGKSYYLIDNRGDGQFTRQDNLDSGVRVPMWVLFKF